MKKVITYGTFDLFHKGHLELLKRARSLGDYLIVAISTDEFDFLEKNKKSIYSYEERSAIVSAIRYVDEVIPEKTWEQKITDVIDHNIDVFVIGEDWKGKFDYLKECCEVVYLSRTEGISSSDVKSIIRTSSNSL